MQKMTVFYTLLILSACFWATACDGGGNNEINPPSIVGTWQCSSLSILRNDIDNASDKAADEYINGAFASVVDYAHITRVFDGNGMTATLTYKNENGTEYTYYSLNYSLQNDSLSLTGDGESHKFHFTLSDTKLMTDCYVNKDFLRILLSDMGKLRPDFSDIRDDYEGRITMCEKKKL